MSAFPQVPDVSAVQGHLFLLVDEQGNAARTKQDFTTCFNLYKEFNKVEGIQPALLQLSMERVEAVMLEFIATKVADPAAQWKGHLMTPEERVKACEGFISQFADSKERVEYVAGIASIVQLSEWRKQREAIDESDAMAAAKISSLLLDIGNQGFNAFDSASDQTNGMKAPERLLLTYRAARASAAIRDASQNPNSNINKQFPTNANARNAAMLAITQANNVLILTKIYSLLTDIHTELLKQVELLDKIVINTDELNKKVTALSTELAAGFAAVNTSLAAVQANLVTLNKTAEETLKVTRAGFTDVNTHLKAANQKLDGLVDQVKVSNGLLTQLNVDLNSGFASVKQTIVDVSNKDFTNVGFFGNLFNSAGNAISDGAQHISDEVSNWF